VFEQSELFPEVIPDSVARIWKAVLDWYRLNHFGTPTVQQIVDRMLLNDPALPSSVEYIRQRRIKHPDLLPWPIRRGQRPPWLHELTQPIDETPVVLNPSDTLHLTTLEGVQVEVAVGEDGILRIVRRWSGGIAGATAVAYAALIILDGMDGTYDHIIHWCRVLASAVHVHF